MLQDKSLEPENLNKEEDKGETIDELVHRHLTDEHHHTTDEEIRNVILTTDEVDFDVPGEEMHEVDDTTVIPPLRGETDEPTSDGDKDDNNNDLPNPYSILGS